MITRCIAAVLLLGSCAFGQERLVFDAEKYSSPADAWLVDQDTQDKWNLWTTEKDAKKYRYKGTVLKSPRVSADRSTSEEGAPALHTVIRGIPNGLWKVSIRYGRGLAVSFDGGEWQNLQPNDGKLGVFDITNSVFSFWADDRFADTANPGSCYYDCVVFEAIPALERGARRFWPDSDIGSIDTDNGVWRTGKQILSQTDT